MSSPWEHLEQSLERLESCWNRLAGSSDRLDKCARRLNQIIDDCNNRLAEINPTVGVWVEDLEIGGLSLGYAKCDGEWCLAVKTRNGSISPLRKANRETRVLAIPHLNRVLVAIAERVEEYADHMEEMFK